MDDSHTNDVLKHKLRAIASLTNEDRNVCQEMKIPGMRLIEKLSHTQRDPNPLKTAYYDQSYKYPILIRKNNRNGLPTHCFPEKRVNDSRRHAYELCKRETTTHWIETRFNQLKEDQQLREKINKQIHALYFARRNDVLTFKNIEWPNQIHVGEVPYSRRRCATKTTPVNIEPKDRIQAVLQTLLPDETLQRLDPNSPAVMNVKKIITKIDLQGMPLLDQARIILKELDPQIRVNPIADGIPNSIVPFKHACHSKMLYMTPIVQEEDRIDKEQFRRDITTLCNIMIDTTQRGTWASTVELTSYNDAPLVDHLTSLEMSHFHWTKFLLTIVSQPCPLTMIEGGTEFRVVAGESHPYRKKNQIGFEYTMYLGHERIAFRNGATNGVFTHSGDLIKNIKMEWCNPEEFKTIITDLMIFTRWEWAFHQTKSMKASRRQTADHARTRMHEVMGTTGQKWRKALAIMWMRDQNDRVSLDRNEIDPDDPEMEVGILHLIPHLEFPHQQPVVLKAELNGDLTYRGRVVSEPPRGVLQSTLSNNFQNNSSTWITTCKTLVGVLKHMYFHAKTNLRSGQDPTRLAEVYEKYMRHMATPSERIKNEYVARSTINALKRSPHSQDIIALCTLFLMKNKGLGKITTTSLMHLKDGSLTVDLDFAHPNSVVHLSSEGDIVFELGTSLPITTQVISLTNLLGFKLGPSPSVDEVLQLNVLPRISDIVMSPNSYNSPDGTQWIVCSGGKVYKLTRDRHIFSNSQLTLAQRTSNLQASRVRHLAGPSSSS
uniref:Polymerase PB2 n=1 Tax=Neotermes castaneus orthomyxovirus 1 TaxID=3133494 RepID=A0AAT9JAI0_9ORTO